MNESTTICPCCEEGTLRGVKREYIADLGEGQQLRIPDIEREVCDRCGEEVLTMKAAREVDSAIACSTDRLAPEKLTAIREEFGVDKTEMSEVLGLGAKTYLRWEQGHQYPSRSMGYYLRVLREFPEAFTWLRQRSWRGRNRIASVEATPLEQMRRRFPVLALDPNRLNSLIANRRNSALAFFVRE